MDLQKTKEIDRLRSLVGTATPRIISLTLIYQIKRETDEIYERRIKSELDSLRYETMKFLTDLIVEKSPDDLKKLWGIYFSKENDTSSDVLPLIVYRSLNVKMDASGQIFVQIGSDITPSIKMEDVRRRGVCDSVEEVGKLLSRISTYWKGFATIGIAETGLMFDEFSISYNLAGLIHENAESLKH